MTQIIKEYSSVDDYINDVKNNPAKLKPKLCNECGCQKIYLNGSYERKSGGRGRETEVKNGTLHIKRFKCSNKSCSQSYSILPSLIPALRWYLWCAQQYILSLFFSGISINQIVKSSKASKNTVKRWISWSKNKWTVFCNELMADHPWLCAISNVQDFYLAIFNRWKLSQAMSKLHHMGHPIP